MKNSNLLLFFIVVAISCVSLFGSPKILEVDNNKNQAVLKFDTNIKSDDFKFTHFVASDGVRKNIYDIKAELTIPAKKVVFENGITFRIAQFNSTTVRAVFEHKDRFFTSSRDSGKEEVSINTKYANASKNSVKEKSLPQIRGFTNKIIVIDPGHGGKDCGAMSVLKKCEKIIVLDISKKLKNELKKRGYRRVYLTREDDTYLTLRSRTKFANDKNADIFISMHANALEGEKAKSFSGFETYFLSNARSERAKRVAALENKDEISSLDTFSKDTLLGVLNTKRIVASNKLAIDIQNSTLKVLRSKYGSINDSGVREGPFWVLVGAQMPSVLVEVGYLSNKNESKRLENSHYQGLIAKGIADGIESYFLKNN